MSVCFLPPSPSVCPPAEATVARIRECLANDLDAPGALDAVDEWAKESLESGGSNHGLEIGAPGLSLLTRF